MPAPQSGQSRSRTLIPPLSTVAVSDAGKCPWRWNRHDPLRYQRQARPETLTRLQIANEAQLPGDSLEQLKALGYIK